jgi:hypothetical protein
MSQLAPDPPPARDGAAPVLAPPRATQPESTSGAVAATAPLNGRMLDSYRDLPDPGGVDRLALHYRRRLAAGGPAGGDPIPQAHVPGVSGRPEVIIGEDNLLPFDFLRTGDRLGRAVVKVVRGDGSAGTGFLVAPGVLLTNHHVLPDAATAAAATATANYEAHPPTDPAGRVSVVPLRPAELFVTDPELDFTFCAVRGLDYLGVIPPDRNGLGVLPNESVNIIQHPRGGMKRVALHDNRVEQADRVVIRYACDTEPGSSGSPVFNNEWRLVALHHASVEVEGGGAGAPPRYLNEGIRLSAIGLWLDSDAAAEGERPDQVARVRALFRGVDPRVGLFGALGRRPRPARGAAQMIVDCHAPDPETLDIAYWDLGAGADLGPARLEALAWVVADLGVDLWCLAGLEARAGRALVEHLERHLGLEYQAHVLPGGSTLLTRRARRLDVEPFAAVAPDQAGEPSRVLVRAADRLDRVVRLVLAPPGAAAARAVAARAEEPPAASRGPRAWRWLGGLVEAARGPGGFDAVLMGPGVPSSPEDLAIIERAALVPRAAAVGPDGGCALVAAGAARIERAIVSGNLVPVLGGPPEIVAAVDRELPSGVRRVATREPIAVRLVFGPPRPLGSEPATSDPSPAEVAAAPAPAAPLERALADLLAPLLARCLADLAKGPGAGPERGDGV